jgi:hypothetical protein
MRRYPAASLALLAAGCATAPTKGPEPVSQVPQSTHTRGAIVGLTAEELIRRLGTPALQIREGDSLKLQFRSDQCVLDAYLYPTANAPYRVTYVDARSRSLGDVDQALCIASIEAP